MDKKCQYVPLASQLILIKFNVLTYAILELLFINTYLYLLSRKAASLTDSGSGFEVVSGSIKLIRPAANPKQPR